MMVSREKMVALAQGQLEAYNKRNLEDFIKFYHKKVVVRKLENNELICDDFDTFTEIYRERFATNLKLHCELKSRIVLKDAVIDEEFVTNGTPEGSHVVAIYQFKDDLISHVTFVR